MLAPIPLPPTCALSLFSLRAIADSFTEPIRIRHPYANVVPYPGSLPDHPHLPHRLDLNLALQPLPPPPSLRNLSTILQFHPHSLHLPTPLPRPPSSPRHRPSRTRLFWDQDGHPHDRERGRTACAGDSWGAGRGREGDEGNALLLDGGAVRWRGVCGAEPA